MDAALEEWHDWFSRRVPRAWGSRSVEVLADSDEVLVLVVLDADACGRGEIDTFREATRDERIAIATAAEAAFGRKVSWGVRAGDVVVLFSTATVPVMTRLRLPDRRVLDTLIDAGIARSRSDALAWCVRLVGEKEQEWLAELREAFAGVESARARGPKARRPAGG